MESFLSHSSIVQDQLADKWHPSYSHISPGTQQGILTSKENDKIGHEATGKDGKRPGMAREIGLRSFMKEGGSDKIILEFSTILGGNMFTGVVEVNIGRAW